ncbi:MAG: bifunctional phosphopantothenoylcysteine decarboxylase/phosphopantothenate--cysteine ligase CoaBC, partial [Dokdonella sp.]
PAQIVEHLLVTRISGSLVGKRVVVTAGPTHEAIDPVRFLGNRSSGRMGFAIAAAARAAGADVTLVAGPVNLPTPRGVERFNVVSAEQMLAATLAAVVDADILVAAAAVADFRVDKIAPHKIKKNGASLQLNLVANPDIVVTVAALPKRPYVVGFAAETENLEARALAKLRDKHLDLIAANEVGTELGFERDDNSLLLLWQGGREELARADKRVLADQLVARIAERISQHSGASA